MAIQTKDQDTKQNPTEQYPKRKFEHQEQAVPGLAKEMLPKPRATLSAASTFW